MIYEHFYEHFMNTFMNTFLRDMNTMNTLRGNNYFFKIKSSIQTIYRVIVCVSIQSLHCVHKQSQSVHKSVHNVFIKTFILGVCFLKSESLRQIKPCGVLFCNNCFSIWVCDWITTCPFCYSRNVHVVPVTMKDIVKHSEVIS